MIFSKEFIMDIHENPRAVDSNRSKWDFIQNSKDVNQAKVIRMASIIGASLAVVGLIATAVYLSDVVESSGGWEWESISGGVYGVAGSGIVLGVGLTALGISHRKASRLEAERKFVPVTEYPINQAFGEVVNWLSSKGPGISFFPSEIDIIDMVQSPKINPFIDQLNALQPEELKAWKGYLYPFERAVFIAVMNHIQGGSEYVEDLKGEHESWAKLHLTGLYSVGLPQLATSINDEYHLTENGISYRENRTKAIQAVNRLVMAQPVEGNDFGNLESFTLKGVADLLKAFTLACAATEDGDKRKKILEGIIALHWLFDIKRKAYDPSQKVEFEFVNPLTTTYQPELKELKIGPQSKGITISEVLYKDVLRMTLVDASGEMRAYIGSRDSKIEERVWELYQVVTRLLRENLRGLQDDVIDEMAIKGMNLLGQTTWITMLHLVKVIRTADQLDLRMRKQQEVEEPQLAVEPLEGSAMANGELKAYNYFFVENGVVYLGHFREISLIDPKNFEKTIGTQLYRVTIPISDDRLPWRLELLPDDAELLEFEGRLPSVEEEP